MTGPLVALERIDDGPIPLWLADAMAEAELSFREVAMVAEDFGRYLDRVAEAVRDFVAGLPKRQRRRIRKGRGSDRTKRLRKKRAKALGQWEPVAAQRRENRRILREILARPRKRPNHRRTPAQVREDLEREAERLNAELRRQGRWLESAEAEIRAEIEMLTGGTT